MGPNHVPFFCIIRIISGLFAILHIISRLEKVIGVRIQCKNWASGTSTTGEQ
jgi:hypothetical protein